MCICWHKCKEMHAFHTQILERRNVNWITCCHAGLVYLAHRGGHQRLLDSHDIPDDSTLPSSKHRKTYGNPEVTCEINLHSWCVCVCLWNNVILVYWRVTSKKDRHGRHSFIYHHFGTMLLFYLLGVAIIMAIFHGEIRIWWRYFSRNAEWYIFRRNTMGYKLKLFWLFQG